MIRERAYAKVNLVLHVGPPAANGLHEVCSLMASIDLADEIELATLESGEDRVVCPSVTGENLAARALAAFRQATATEIPPVELRIRKRIPVAAGLGGGSADAAAALRAVNELAGRPLETRELLEIARELGSDVPSQVEPRHALVTGTGDQVEPIGLPLLVLVLVPQPEGLATGQVYAELDRLGGARPTLDPEPLRRLAAGSAAELATGVENDLQPAALSLRPELRRVLDELLAAGAVEARICGSGPTCFGLFGDLGDAQRACSRVAGSLVAGVRE